MDVKNLTTRFLSYNLWANERLGSWLLSLDRSVIYEKTGSSFGTIDRTIQHILAAQVYWHNIIFNEKINQFDRPLRDNAIEEVISDLIASSQQLIDSHVMLSEQHLLEKIKASDSSQSRYEYILHIVNHGSYHRGQIVSMCRALSVAGEIPVTDYDGYLWWIENAGD